MLLHAEEVVALAAGLRLPPVVRAAAVDQLALAEEALAADAVEALVLAVVDVAAVVDRPQDVAHHPGVAFLGGADEVVVADEQRLPGVAEALGHAVDEGLGIGAGAPGGEVDVLAVLVGAGQVEGVVAVEAVEAGQEVGHHRRVGVAEVGLGVDVVDRRGEVDGAVHGEGRPPGGASGYTEIASPPPDVKPRSARERPRGGPGPCGRPRRRRSRPGSPPPPPGPPRRRPPDRGRPRGRRRRSRTGRAR